MVHDAEHEGAELLGGEAKVWLVRGAVEPGLLGRDGFVIIQLRHLIHLVELIVRGPFMPSRSKSLKSRLMKLSLKFRAKSLDPRLMSTP